MHIHVLLADDHGVVRDGLRRLFEDHHDIKVLAAVGNGLEALKETKRLEPHVVLMDLAMPVLGGIEATRAILEARPETGVIILSFQDSSALIHRAVKAGARGYLTKESSADEVVKAVRSVAAGKRYFPKGIAEKLFDALEGARSSADAIETLTATERDIVRLIADGNSNAEAAAVLQLSPRTVETYRIRLMRKLDLTHLPSLVKFAIRHGITSLD
jgi:DNA-binding NarL/FixJ family response regulator